MSLPGLTQLKGLSNCLNLDTLDNCHKELSMLPERAKFSRDEVLGFIDSFFFFFKLFFFFSSTPPYWVEQRQL